jgi:transcriptional regulator with XRE-family HTH domain
MRDMSEKLIDPQKLKQARGARRVGEVAQVVGVTPTYIYSIERGLRAPSDGLLAKLCREYRVPVTRLINENFLANT